MGFAGDERAQSQFTSEELRDLFSYTAGAVCDTHAHLTRNPAAASASAVFWSDATKSPADAALSRAMQHGDITFLGRIGAERGVHVYVVLHAFFCVNAANGTRPLTSIVGYYGWVWKQCRDYDLGSVL